MIMEIFIVVFTMSMCTSQRIFLLLVINCEEHMRFSANYHVDLMIFGVLEVLAASGIYKIIGM